MINPYAVKQTKELDDNSQSKNDRNSEEEIVELDEDKKAAMVSNLLVVLCADEAAQPVVNTGTLNH